MSTQFIFAQCAAGFTSCAINFDMQYFSTLSLPASPVNYTFGRNSMRMAWSGVNTFRGTLSEHTGETSSFGTGNDLKYIVGSGADTLVFDKEVSNLLFSIYDIDLQQRVVVTAQNATGIPLNITLAKIGASTLTIAGSGTTSASATSTSTAYSNSTTNGTANITIAGPVKTVVLTFTKLGGAATDSLYISDMSACNNYATAGSWAAGYQSISTPEVGQSSYIMTSYGDSIVAVDMANNTASLIYEVGNSNLISVGSAPSSINSLAYDPYKQIVYFSDNARTITNTAIYKYDVKTGVKSTWIADVRTFGIQLFTIGMGSGGASYYDGALYIGQDMSSSVPSIEPVTVYRIDIDSITGSPIRASRVWGKIGYTGTNQLYDWADFVINDSVLYNFNTANNRVANTGLEHISLNTQSVIIGYTASGVTSGSQAGVNYAGNVYRVLGTTYALYNGAGAFGSSTSYTGTTGTTLTDAGESFKYPYDYGDAPISYGIAHNLFSAAPKLKIGLNVDYEVYNSSNSSATADDIRNTGISDDEDGVSIIPEITTATTSYNINVQVVNITGSTATLYGYIDFNRDGDFKDAGEISLATSVPDGLNGDLPVVVKFTELSGGITGSSFIRFRLASKASEVVSPFGYAGSGENEDYPIYISEPALPVELVNFTAIAKNNNTVQLDWQTASEFNNDYFEVRRKQNNIWKTLGKVQGKGFSNSLNAYNFMDEAPYDGINYYQLKQVDFDGTTEYSPIISVIFDDKNDENKTSVILYPNPTQCDVWIKTTQEINSNNPPDIDIFNIVGEKLQSFRLTDKLQRIDFREYQNGMYLIKIDTQIYRILKR